MDEFDHFWHLYPRKVAKAAAMKAWGRLRLCAEDIDAITDAVQLQSRTVWADKDSQFIPHAATWLNGRRWEDEIEAPKKKLAEPTWSDWVCEHAPVCISRWACNRRAQMDAFKQKAS